MIENKEEFEKLRDSLTDEGKKHLRLLLNSHYGVVKPFNHTDLWQDLDNWAVANRYPSWKKQKEHIISIASNHGVNVSKEDWKKIFKRYDELHDKFYFLGWELDGIPWIESKIETFSKPTN